MSYNLCMKRSFSFVPLLIALLSLSSCGNVFFDASNALKEIRDGSTDIPDPRRIFIGGDFLFDWDMQREGFYVTNGAGNPETTFLSSANRGLVIGTVAGTRGVLDIVLSGDGVYVAGNFEGVDTIGDYTVNSEFKSLIKYSLNGTHDLNYKPFATIINFPEVRSIHVPGDGTLLVGGNFDPLGGYPDFVHVSSTEGGVLATPAVPDGGFINSVQPAFGNTVTVICGAFSTVGSQSGYSGFAVIDNNSLEPVPRSYVVSDPLSMPISEAIDSAWFGDSLYLAASGGSITGVFKYNFSGTQFVEDSQFYTNFTGAVPTGGLSTVDVISTDDKGRIYIGGSFYLNTANEHQGLIRLNSNGTVDESFRVTVAGSVNAIEIQKNGKILIGGFFTQLNGEPGFNGLARLFDFGSIDFDFDRSLPGVNGNATINAIAVEEEPEGLP